MILLVFRPVYGELPVSVRGTYFRICADATLRGPDNGIAASYCKGLWHLGHRQHRSFECSGPLYLRVVNSHGKSERTGPYDFVKTIAGALFTHVGYLGAYALEIAAAGSAELWHEITFLPTPGGS